MILINRAEIRTEAPPLLVPEAPPLLVHEAPPFRCLTGLILLSRADVSIKVFMPLLLRRHISGLLLLKIDGVCVRLRCLPTVVPVQHETQSLLPGPGVDGRAFLPGHQVGSVVEKVDVDQIEGTERKAQKPSFNASSEEPGRVEEGCSHHPLGTFPFTVTKNIPGNETRAFKQPGVIM